MTKFLTFSITSKSTHLIRTASEEVLTSEGLDLGSFRNRISTAGLKAVVVPEIDAIGNYYLITLEAIDAHSGKQIARQQEETNSKDQVVAALGKAASQLRRQLGESRRTIQGRDVSVFEAVYHVVEHFAMHTGQIVLLTKLHSPGKVKFYEDAGGMAKPLY